MIKKLIGSWLIQLFCVLWAVFLFLDYIYHSDYFVEAFKYCEYSDLIFIVIVLVFGVTYLLSNRKKLGVVLEIRNFRGIYHYLFVLILMALIMFFYLIKMGVIPGPASGTFSFILRTIMFHVGLVVILLSALSIGSWLLEKLPFTLDKSSSVLVGLAIGFFVITLGLFLLGIFGLLYPFIVIPFLLVLIIPGRKKLFAVINQILFKKSEPFNIHMLAVFAYAFLIFLIAITLALDTRTIPLGYDGLSLYMNVPKLIAGYHGLTNGGDAYNWSIFMSLGFIMYNNVTITLLISIIPGILSLFVIYKICINLGISRSWSLFACALFYSLPNTIWLSRNDEKVDLALLYVTLCCVLLFTGNVVAKNIKKASGRFEKLFRFAPDIVLWGLCGCLIGFAFGIKYTSMLNIFAFLVLLFYTNSGKYGAIAIFFLNFAIIFALDLTKFAAFEKDHTLFRFIIPFVLSLIALFFAFRENRSGLLLSGKKAIIFLSAIGFSFLPWAIKNISENKKLSFDSLLTGKSPLPELYPETSKVSGDLGTALPDQTALNTAAKFSKTNFAGFGLTALPEDSSQRIQSKNRNGNISEFNHLERKRIMPSANTEKDEEIRRYLGYETGIIRFISLPYDIVMKTNVKLVISDSGILLLILVPVFIFVFKIRHLPWNILKMIFLLFILIVSIISVQLIKGPIDYNVVLDPIKSNSFSDASFFSTMFLPVYIFIKQQLITSEKLLMPVYNYLTTQQTGICFVIIMLFTVPLFYLFKSSFAGLSFISKSFIAFVFCVIQYWLILSSGIIYYGIAGFSLIPVIIALLAVRDEQGLNKNKFIKRYVCVCAATWFILILPFQLMPVKFLYETDKSKLNLKEFIELPFVKYAIGVKNERDVFKQFFSPAQQNIIAALNRDKNSKIINVSTFLNYFIVNNDSRVYKDNQLGIFELIYFHAKNDKTLLAKEYKKNNIRYILVSLKTADIDMTPDKSLTKKFNELMIALVNNPEIQLLYTNRIVERPDGDMDIPVNGQLVKAKYDVVGKSILDPGTDALFEIL